MEESTTNNQSANPHQDDNEQTLTNDEIQRYSRQLVLPQFATEGQTRLKNATVLIVGVGGLGTPAALYLTGAGIGTLGLVDDSNDVVDASNLHRQVLYTEADVGHNKLEAAASAIRLRNHHVRVRVHNFANGLRESHATALAKQYHVVLDCTDNVRTRYVIGDACAVAAVPLVSGAAIGLSGQLMTLGLSVDSPCYRCILPIPPPAACVGSCDSAGVVGPAPAIIGVLQALEAIKIISKFQSASPLDKRLLLFDAATSNFRNVKLRSKLPSCIVCAPGAAFSPESFDYDAFIKGEAPSESFPANKVSLDPRYRITIQQFASLRKDRQKYNLIDVRPPAEFSICHLDESESKPLPATFQNEQNLAAFVADINKHADTRQTIIICRRGNKSQTAVQNAITAGAQNVVDVIGGLKAWHFDIDKNFPLY